MFPRCESSYRGFRHRRLSSVVGDLLVPYSLDLFGKDRKTLRISQRGGMTNLTLQSNLFANNMSKKFMQI